MDKENKTKLVVVRDFSNQGKSTLLWMVLLELMKQKADKISCKHIYNGEEITLPNTLPPYEDRWDFVAELLWHKLHIVIISYGDVYNNVDKALQNALQLHPDYIICAANIKHWGTYTWQLFETKYKNTDYDRVCFWSEKAVDAKDEERVKRPTVEAIIKYIR